MSVLERLKMTAHRRNGQALPAIVTEERGEKQASLEYSSKRKNHFKPDAFYAKN